MMLADLIKATVTFVIANYSLSFFLLGLIVSVVAIARSGVSIDRPLVVEKLLSWYVFFSIGIDNFYNFVMHVFFGGMSAAFIGWADSPFQFEVGTASLGYAAVGCSQRSGAMIFVSRPCSARASSRWGRQPVTSIR